MKVNKSFINYYWQHSSGYNPISKSHFKIRTSLEFLFHNWKRNCSTSFRYNSQEHALYRYTLGVRHRNSILRNDLQIQMFRRHLYNTLFLFYYPLLSDSRSPCLSHWESYFYLLKIYFIKIFVRLIPLCWMNYSYLVSLLF